MCAAAPSRSRRRSLRVAVAAGALAGSALLAGCATAVGGIGEPAAPSPGASTAGAPTAGAPGSVVPAGGFPVSAAGLRALVEAGSLSESTLHIALTGSGSSLALRGHGQERLEHGRLVAIDLSERAGPIAIRFIYTDAHLFAQVPSSIYPSTKPWVAVSSTTTDPRLHSLYTSFQNAQDVDPTAQIGALLGAARTVRLLGAEQVAGAPVGRYAIDVEVARLPSSYPGRAALQTGGVTTLPLMIIVDQRGRITSLTEKLTVLGEAVTSSVVITDIDAPVSITAPPAAQVETP